jgi:hypothetical protein
VESNIAQGHPFFCLHILYTPSRAHGVLLAGIHGGDSRKQPPAGAPRPVLNMRQKGENRVGSRLEARKALILNDVIAESRKLLPVLVNPQRTFYD